MKKTNSTCVDCGRAVKHRRRCTTCTMRRRPLHECRVCSEPRRIAASGMCGACYSRERRERLGRAAYADHSLTCEFCSAVYITKDSRSRYCSLTCAARDQRGWSKSKELAVVAKPRHWAGHVLPSLSGFTAGSCTECGDRFVAQGSARYCSDGCSKRASWRRRYERRGEFKVSERVRIAIYERDGWVCQLCREPVDPGVDTNDVWGHTLDHVVPQSRQLVPDHSPSNLRLAHRICNSLRGDGSKGVDDGESVEAMWYVGRVPPPSS